MKLFKYFTYSEIKDICIKLEKAGCEYRHPKTDFMDAIGADNVNKLLKMGWIKDSKPLEQYWIDYRQPCFEYGIGLRRMSHFTTNSFWLWFKIYFIQYYTIKYTITRFFERIGLRQKDRYAEEFYAVES